MFFAITMRDGTVGAMQVARANINPRDEIAKWPADRRELVGDVIPIDQATYELICSSRRTVQPAPPLPEPKPDPRFLDEPPPVPVPSPKEEPEPEFSPTPPPPDDSKPGWGAILAAADAHDDGDDLPDLGPVPEALPPPVEQPLPPEPTPLPVPHRPVDLRSDEQVRQEASETIQRAAREREAALLEGGEMAQIRYETAIKARNGSGDAQALLLDEARQRGMAVKELAEQIIAERKAREAQAMRVYATLAKVERLLEVAHSDEVAGLIAEGIAEIERH